VTKSHGEVSERFLWNDDMDISGFMFFLHFELIGHVQDGRL
jgi:hypothetical protein